MEHHQRLLHLSPHQEGQVMIGQGLLDGDSMHFNGDDGFAVAAGVADDSAWLEDLMHLGEVLFGGGNGNNDGLVVGMVGADQARQQQQELDGALRSYDDVISPVSGRDDGDLSGTRKMRDRFKTIVSERKRRFRMKEKLHELRALVPNITKMDKASIIADAVEYIKNLQTRARKLEEDVAALQARPRSPGRRQQHQQQQKDLVQDAGGARVTLVSVAQVGEGRFFVTVECEQRDGVVAPLCAAMESLSGFVVETSNLGCSSDRVVSTLTLKVNEAVRENVMVGERTVKLWVMAALLSEGFRPEATSEIC